MRRRKNPNNKNCTKRCCENDKKGSNNVMTKMFDSKIRNKKIKKCTKKKMKLIMVRQKERR